VEWNDAKGYGWVNAGGKRVFAHIKDTGRSGLDCAERAQPLFGRDPPLAETRCHFEFGG
jgi:hypothetical protein